MPKQFQFDDHFMNNALDVAKLSNCVSRKVGAVIVLNNRQISEGYNGTPAGCFNCGDKHKDYDPIKDREKHHEFSQLFEIHAEVNAIAFAMKNSINIENSTIYCTLQPCSDCLKAMVACGVKRIVFKDYYDLGKPYCCATKYWLEKSNVTVEVYNPNISQLK